MKKIILIGLSVLVFNLTHAQQADPSIIPPVNNFETHCYVNGVRLDSINAPYATFDAKLSGQILFDYGQVPNTKKAMLITDSRNNPLSFVRNDNMFVLNLLYYNGWEFFKTTAPLQPGFPSTIILKKSTGNLHQQ